MAPSAEFNAENIDIIYKSVLYARLDTVDYVPHFLSSPISVAAAKTVKQLRIVIISSLFNADKTESSSSALGTTRWDEVQSILTYVYVQATRVAQEMGKILMDVDVLLKGEDEPVSESIHTDVHVVFRVSQTREYIPIDRLIPDGCKTIWLPETDNITATPDPIPSSTRKPEQSLPTCYPVVALGGTFDHLHAGHKILLSMAAWIARDKLIVGMTEDVLLQKKANKEIIQPIQKRIEITHSFMRLFRPQVTYELVPIHDVCGPTGWDPNIQALVVSKETMAGAEVVAKERKEKSLPPLQCFVIDVISHSETNLDAEDAEALRRTKMSSTFIREWIVQQSNKQ